MRNKVRETEVPKLPGMEPKEEGGVLFIRGINKSFIQRIEHDSKALNYTRAEFLNKILDMYYNQFWK